MGGDYSRVRFDPAKAFAGVLKQQGRVSLDAEFNEYVDLLDRHWRAETLEVIGPCGVPHAVPREPPGTSPEPFLIRRSGSGGSTDLTIGRGRAYVHGILVECRGDTTSLEPESRLGEERGNASLAYTDQPFYYGAGFPELSASSSATDLVYIDVWEREVTAIQDPELLEEALGGPDTTSRLQVAWQVKVRQNVGEIGCDEDDTLWAGERSTAQLSSQAAAGAPAPGPCEIRPGGGYTGLENRLYRVEIHVGGTLDTARFKWSRDNATLVASVVSITAADTHSIIEVPSTGRDQGLRFENNDYAELLDDHVEFGARDRGAGGSIAKILDVDHVNGRITVDQNWATFAIDQDRHPRLRRWDVKDTAQDVLRDTEAGVAIDLENGIAITFGPDTAAVVHAGDYWVFAARTATGTIEELHDAPPRGVVHHFCRLALVNRDATPVVRDCRRAFPPLTDIHAEDVAVDDACLPSVATLQDVFDYQCAARLLRYVGGDGQEQLPGTELDAQLVVAVEDGFGQPVANVAVTFTVTGGGGTVQPASGGGAGSGLLEVHTDTDGTARVRWTIGATAGDNEVRVVLSSAMTQPRVIFHARGLTAGDVAVTDPCDLGVSTVQGVFSKQCASRVLRYVSGDGQEGRPGTLLDGDLVVGVENGFGRPHPGVPVHFSVQTGGGSVSATTVPTGTDGLARCQWTLGAALGENEVRAELASGGLPVLFHAMGEVEGVTEQLPRLIGISWQNDRDLRRSLFNAGLRVTFSEEMHPETITADTFIVTLEVPVEDVRPTPGAVLRYRGHYEFIVSGSVTGSPDGKAWTFQPVAISAPMLAAWLLAEATGSATGILQGNVRDPAGAPLPNAQLILTDPNTGVIRNALSDSQGAYTFSNLPAGTYELQVRLIGFSVVRLADVPVLSDQVLTIDVPLGPNAPLPKIPHDQYDPDRLRCRAKLKANAIFSLASGRPLDGDAFGSVRSDNTIDLTLPSGDGRRGGDFDSWFWLIEGRVRPTGTIPTGTIPTGTIPTGTIPTGTVPTGTIATGTIPTGTMPTGTLVLGGTGVIVGTIGVRGTGVVAGTGGPVATGAIDGTPPIQPSLFNPADFPGRHVNEVGGIGAAFERALEANGITSLAAFASMQPAELARVLGVSEVRAIAMIDEARGLLRP